MKMRGTLNVAESLSIKIMPEFKGLEDVLGVRTAKPGNCA